MNRKKIIALILSTALFSLAGCSNINQEKVFSDDDIVATVGNINMDYAATCTYTKMMQAETYSYLKNMFSSFGSTSSRIWAQQMDESKKTYGEQFNETSLSSIRDILIANLHKNDYGIEFTKEDKLNCEQVANDFIANTDKKALESMNTDFDALMDVLELMTVETKMKSKIMNDVDVEFSEADAKQASFNYLKVKNEKEAKKIINEVNDGSDIKTVAENNKLTLENGNYTVSSPEYDKYDSMMLDVVLNLKEGECDYYSNDGQVIVVYMNSLNDKDATNAKIEELTLKKKNDVYEETIEAWKLQDKVVIDDDAWKTIEANDKVIFEKKELDVNKDNINGGTISSGDTTTSIDITSSDGGDVNATVY